MTIDTSVLIFVAIAGLAVATAIFLLSGVYWGRRQGHEGLTSFDNGGEISETVNDAVTSAVSQALSEAVHKLDTANHKNLQGSINSILSVASSKLGDQLSAGKSVIDRERAEIDTAVTSVGTELRRMNRLVSNLRKESAHHAGQIHVGLENAAKVTSTLSNTTHNLEQALASSQARGQWGERMAEDVLTAAGFLEGVNFFKQKKQQSGGIPDFTFPLPSGQVVHMDVKFPFNNYLRWLEAETDAEKATLGKSFVKDVRDRVREIAERSYVESGDTVDYVILFVPNESVYGFLHEHDCELIDFALKNKVVMCSPTTLFAVLAVIRQAVDSFTITQRGDEILQALDGLRTQWDKWCEPVKKMEKGLGSAQKAFDELSGRRTREFERQLKKLEDIRDGSPELAEHRTTPKAQDEVTPAETELAIDLGENFAETSTEGLFGDWDEVNPTDEPSPHSAGLRAIS